MDCKNSMDTDDLTVEYIMTVINQQNNNVKHQMSEQFNEIKSELEQMKSEIAKMFDRQHIKVNKYY